MALRQEIAAQAVGYLAGINLVVLLFGRGDGPLHQRMSHLNGAGVRQQMVIDPARKNGRLHRNRAGLWKSSNPRIQLAPRRANFAFPLDTTRRVLHAIADRLLVYVQSDVLHVVSEEPPRLFSESACR